MKNRTTHILKHKNIDTAYLWIEDDLILDVTEIKEPEHLPYKFENIKEKNVRLLNNWLAKRGIPFSREDYEEIIDKYEVNTSKELTILANGLNLTDHYWFCDANNEKKWEDVNYLDNKFSARIGEIMPESAEKHNEYLNPDFSSNGRLIKFWIIENNKRYLCKAGSRNLKQEPYNEYLASIIAQRLNIDCLEYKLCEYNNDIFSKCECMMDKNNEYIEAFSVFLYGEKSGNKYNDYIKICENKGIKNAEEEINKMIVLDYLIRNTDRHTGNYGILRNSETLKWEKIVPIFDNGSSFWYNATSINNIIALSSSQSKSFTGENEKNIELIKTFDWYDKKALNNIKNIAIEVFDKNKNMEKERIEKISNSLEERLINLNNFIKKK